MELSPHTMITFALKTTLNLGDDDFDLWIPAGHPDHDGSFITEYRF